jgi:hypothetical protein
MIPLRELVISNPDFFTSSTSIGQLRNSVLLGNAWSNISIGVSSGVVVSQNTPLAGLSSANTNLWYVVNGQASNHSVMINGSGIIVEVKSGVLDASKFSPPTPRIITALIASNTTQLNALKTNGFKGSSDGSKEYSNGKPATPAYQQWAEAVRDNTAMPGFQ